MSPEAPKAKSFADILQQNQEFIAHLQTLQDDMGAQLAEKAKELALVKTGKGAQVVYIDEKIRGLLNLPDNKKVLVAPGLVPGWGIFVQSKNAGRFMRPGRLLIRKA